MAVLDDTSLVVSEESWRLAKEGYKNINWDKLREEEDDWLEKKLEYTYAQPTGMIKGSIIQFPVADGYAWYLVSKLRPLTLQHVSLGDGYAIPDPYIRGLTKEDIIDIVEREKKWHGIFLRNTRKEG